VQHLSCYAVVYLFMQYYVFVMISMFKLCPCVEMVMGEEK
jgi:hypothetical protein